MTALLLKDLRLSLDVLRPWALMVVGLAIGLAMLRLLPATLMPDDLRDMRTEDVLVLIGGLVAASGIAVGAWIASSIVQGDRTHGAAALAAVLPSSAGRRVGAKLVALAMAIAPIPLTAFVALSASALLSAERTSAYWRSFGYHSAAVCLGGVAACFVAAGLASFVAQIVRGAFAAVAIAILSCLVAAGLGALGGTLGLWAFHRDVAAFAVTHSGDGEAVALRFSVVTSGAIAATALSGAAALMVACLAMSRHRSRRWTATAGAAIAAISLLGAVAIVQPVIGRGASRWLAYQIDLASRLPPNELAVQIQQLGLAGGFTIFGLDRPAAWHVRRWAVYEVAAEYRRHLAADSLEIDPVEATYRRAEDLRSERGVIEACYGMATADPRWLPTVLDGISRWPSLSMMDALLQGLAQRDLYAGEYRRPFGTPETHDYDTELARETAIRQLERLLGQGHPEQDRLQRAVDALRRAATRLDPPSAPEPTP